MNASPTLPAGMVVFERGWLSANNILFTGPGPTALVDTGYHTHAPQTLALVQQVLGARPLELVLNSHLHSDHCGGNAALQAAYPGLQTWIPPGQAAHVASWDPVALSYAPTGQHCPPFRCDGLLRPGMDVELGGCRWTVHAAPGHDPHSVILFEADSGTLLSADALWQTGFGVVFPELEGEHAFAEVGATLDLIEALAPRTVVPGHGAAFVDVGTALTTARQRLASFTQNPEKHARHAAKVLLKFKLLEVQRQPLVEFIEWALRTPYFGTVHQRYFGNISLVDWLESLLDELSHANALTLESGAVVNR